jgi:hypothetical protein
MGVRNTTPLTRLPMIGGAFVPSVDASSTASANSNRTA